MKEYGCSKNGNRKIRSEKSIKNKVYCVVIVQAWSHRLWVDTGHLVIRCMSTMMKADAIVKGLLHLGNPTLHVSWLFLYPIL